MLARVVNLRVQDIAICYFKKSHLFPLKDWRNRQIDILRQNRLLTDRDQAIWYAKVRRDKHQAIFSLKHAISGKDEGIFIGYCGITNIDTEAKRGEISFLVNPIFTHENALYRDIFLKTLYLLSLYAFEKLRLREIFTETYLFRNKHIKILEEFGFCRKCILEKRKFIKNKYWDSVIHRFTFKDWHEKKHKIKIALKKQASYKRYRL